MTRTTPTTWAMAAAITLLVGMSWQLDGPSDTQAAQDSAATVADATRAAAAQQRFTQAARRICGPNANWVEQGGGAIACTTKRGHPTGVIAQLSQAKP